MVVRCPEVCLFRVVSVQWERHGSLQEHEVFKITPGSGAR